MDDGDGDGEEEEEEQDGDINKNKDKVFVVVRGESKDEKLSTGRKEIDMMRAKVALFS